MKKLTLLFLLFFFKIAGCYGSNSVESNALLYWFAFEDGIKVIDSSTILIVANGINKEIRLQGVCSTGTEQKDKKAELLIRQLLEGKRSGVNTPPAESRWLRLTAKAGAVSFADSLRTRRQL